MLGKLFNNLAFDKYVSYRLILALDLFISAGVSLFSLFLTGVLFQNFQFNLILIYWVCTALVSSLVVFLLLQTHKVVIRHSTLRGLWRFGVAALGKVLLMGVFI